MRRKIEILAPAGSYEGMKAAMNAGCDAVYIGGSSFGARAYANNLDEETLLQAIDEAHIRDKRLYLTVNTLLKEKERTNELFKFLEKYYLQGLDAVIVQDVGVMHFIHRHFPDLPIHASTQTTLTMAQGANLLKEYGVTRLVTARELSLSEIKVIRDNTDLEIETFVHGALCYCYSGQCLMSSMIGGRSGNRGRCAQPCRMPYQFLSEDRKLSSEKEKYLLSPKDINTIAIIPELVEAGIDSFKIEGRMKRPEYAATVASLYRKYIDLYNQLGKEKYQSFLNRDEFREDMLNLQDIYNRGGFSEGYGKVYHGKKMMSLSRPNHSGVYVGEVIDSHAGQISISVKESVNAQDILEIRHKEEEGYEFTVKNPHSPGDILTTRVGRRPDLKDKPSKDKGKKESKAFEPNIRIGDLVYRTRNNTLLEKIAAEYILKEKQVGIKGQLTVKLGEKLMLTVSFGEVTATAYQDTVQEALKQPMSEDKLRAPIEKTGDTLYYFEELLVLADSNVFVPVAWLNEIRRDAISQLQEEVRKRYRRGSNITGKLEDINTSSSPGTGRLEVCASVQTQEQLDVILRFPEISAVYVDYDLMYGYEFSDLAQRVKQAGKSFYLSLPHICRLAEYERLQKELPKIWGKDTVHGFIIKNFEEIALLRSLKLDEHHDKEFILNHNMYTYNKEAKQFFGELGIHRYTAPLELNYQELKLLGIEDSDMIVYGYLPLMVSAQCLFESTDGCKKCKENNKGSLIDRLGKKFYVQTNCKGCYNIIYNGQALALHKQAEEVNRLRPYRIRLDFTMETALQTEQVIKVFLEKYQFNHESTTELEDYTTGHFKRGVD